MPECDPIGTVRTPFETPDDAPRQGFLRNARGTIELDSAYAPGLAGFEAGDAVLVVWFADRADHSVVTIQRDGERGVFTTRSPERPNPIGITRCAIRSIDGAVLDVSGVDMLDGTPILDLKPPLDHPTDPGE